MPLKDKGNTLIYFKRDFFAENSHQDLSPVQRPPNTIQVMFFKGDNLTTR